MMEAFQYIEAIASSGQPTLVLGETGSGKELVARAIHDVSGLPGDFVPVDVSGLDDLLFSDTLFGHAKGAYTGADKTRAGLLEKAQDGTIFLDEIGDLSEVSQMKLLRLLQEGVYYPLGSDQPKKCRARVVAAANKDLQKLAGHSGSFRMDLYYRLSTHLLKVPPLRARRDDIPLLVKHLVAEAANSMGKPVPTVSKEAIHLLLRHPFYGNIRELKTYLYDAVARCGGQDIPQQLIADRLGDNVAVDSAGIAEGHSLERLFGQFPKLEELANYAIAEALEITSHNQSQAARLLGLSKQALHKRLKKKPRTNESPFGVSG